MAQGLVIAALCLLADGLCSAPPRLSDLLSFTEGVRTISFAIFITLCRKILKRTGVILKLYFKSSVCFDVPQIS